MADEQIRLLPIRRNGDQTSGSFKVKVAQGSVLATVALERLAFYSLTGNLVLFLNSYPFLWESYNALNASFFFLGVTCFSSFFGGLVADTCLGRFKTLIVSLLIYIAGYVFFPVIAEEHGEVYKYGNSSYKNFTLPPICGKMTDPDNLGPGLSESCNSKMDDVFKENCSGLVYVILLVVAIGAGTFKSNITPFGADQVRSEGSRVSLTFFNWYYWCVNLGTLIALTLVTFVQQTYGFFEGYLTAIGALGGGLIIFLFGFWTYIYRPRIGSVLTTIFRIIKEAVRMKHKRKKRKELTGRQDSVIDPIEQVGNEAPSGWLDYAKYRYGGSFHESAVDDVKKLGKILCVFITLIPYWIVYSQMETTFLLQGLHMKLNLTQENITVECQQTKSCSDSHHHTKDNSSHPQDSPHLMLLI
ncbi:hypothetical protein KUTeg_009935 [Tegillarca granosa]|uniref:Solute carrier family 15 member 4 n=1 Tax=Tegillarca granosa TaxID=220873 RepID=A0ABQ9F5B1_TEGGR|nr:hypothetical protein KUTeg_009935 [Tegillarca granosa]